MKPNYVKATPILQIFQDKIYLVVVPNKTRIRLFFELWFIEKGLLYFFEV